MKLKSVVPLTREIRYQNRRAKVPSSLTTLISTIELQFPKGASSRLGPASRHIKARDRYDQSLQLWIERDTIRPPEVSSFVELSNSIPGASTADIGLSFHHTNSSKQFKIHITVIGKRNPSQTKCRPETSLEMRR
jgi:hypothetical protein